MKINPNLQYDVVFWAITLPVIPFIVLLVLLCVLLSPITTRPMNFTEKVVTKFALWRNNLPVVKNAYDKVHLFDYLRS
jgi:hypothetical protein